jgi:GNAT superfamily N-acetyltransferase
MSLAYRLAEERDLALVVDSWLKSYRDSHAAGLIPVDMWASVMAPIIRDRILTRPGLAVWVAYHPGESQPNDVHGWICVERDYKVRLRGRERLDGSKPTWVEKWVTETAPCVHYVYVKEKRRKMGIARGLFKAAGVNPLERFNYSCKTGVVSELKRVIPSSSWMPDIPRHPK